MTSWNSTNGAWLPGIWDSPETLFKTLDYMRDHKVEYLFPTTKTLTKDGKFQINSNFMIYLHQFMGTIKEYEDSPRACGKKFKVIPAVGMCFQKENVDEFFEFENEEAHRNAVASVRQFIVPEAEDSFVTGMPRDFDGVQFSVGRDDVYNFEILKKFLREVKATTGKIVSLAVPGYGRGWGGSGFYYSALYVDLLTPMCFNTSCQTPEEYQANMKDQVYNILYGVSGQYARNHGRPGHGIKVLFGFPCFPDSEDTKAIHNSAAENIAAAAKGAAEGAEKLIAEGNDALDFAAGASLYMFSDGKGKDGYSTEQDMDDFGKYWAYEKHDYEEPPPPPPPTKDIPDGGDKGGETPGGDPDNSSNTPLVKVFVVVVLMVCAWIISVG
ncbi:hypothetical protein TWF718_007458 [Orbilia javanica]|uniref:Chitinase n=1 Tax=Orbilia javanica TaxID=47235 RepID=A0AAN8MZC0_9PEZI